jgi:hypothetical protein
MEEAAQYFEKQFYAAHRNYEILSKSLVPPGQSEFLLRIRK